jgi:hypothetical protein
MLRFRKGELVGLVDVNGERAGLAMYMDTHPPGTIDVPRNDDVLWHFSVLDGAGKVRYLCTSKWTLIPVDPDPCNP